MEPVTPEEQARRDKRWEKLQAAPRGSGTGALGELLSAFSAGMGHNVDEQRRQHNTGYQLDTEGDPLGVDLVKGVVTIRRTERQVTPKVEPKDD